MLYVVTDCKHRISHSATVSHYIHRAGYLAIRQAAWQLSYLVWSPRGVITWRARIIPRTGTHLQRNSKPVLGLFSTIGLRGAARRDEFRNCVIARVWLATLIVVYRQLFIGIVVASNFTPLLANSCSFSVHRPRARSRNGVGGR